MIARRATTKKQAAKKPAKKKAPAPRTAAKRPKESNVRTKARRVGELLQEAIRTVLELLDEIQHGKRVKRRAPDKKR